MRKLPTYGMCYAFVKIVNIKIVKNIYIFTIFFMEMDVAYTTYLFSPKHTQNCPSTPPLKKLKMRLSRPLG